MFVLLLPSGGCKWSDLLTMNERVCCKDSGGQTCYMEPALSSLVNDLEAGEHGRGHRDIQYELMGKSGTFQSDFKFSTR